MALRKQAHRAKFLKTAVVLFGKHGYHATTVPMIVKASGSSTGSFYFYFRNKEDVFAAALEAFGEKISAAVNSAMAEAGEDLVKQMRAAVECSVKLLAENPSEARILIVESSGLGPKLEATRRKIIDSHARSVEQAIAQLRPAHQNSESALLARCWMGSVYESMYHWLERSPSQRHQPGVIARAVADFNLRGIGAI